MQNEAEVRPIQDDGNDGKISFFNLVFPGLFLLIFVLFLTIFTEKTVDFSGILTESE